eukprot:278191-Chlamydomonas_euryale.AAC.4
MLSPSATVVRGGKRVTVEAADLVPGDIVVVKSGDRIPADMRVVEVTNLQVGAGPNAATYVCRPSPAGSLNEGHAPTPSPALHSSSSVTVHRQFNHAHTDGLCGGMRKPFELRPPPACPCCICELGEASVGGVMFATTRRGVRTAWLFEVPVWLFAVAQT